MTASLSAENFEALKAGELIARDFAMFVVRDFATGAPVTDAYWSDDHDTTVHVIDPETGGSVEREYRAGGGLIAISDIPRVSTLTVQQVTITLSKVSARVNDLVRAYDCKQGTVQIHRGLYDPQSMRLVAPAYSRFYGFINEAPIRKPRENEPGDVKVICTSHAQEITRASADTRSDASQRRRNPSDNFYQDVAVVGGWTINWGRDAGPAPSIGGRE